MGLTASDSGGTFALCPEGTHAAICVQVIDMGQQWSDFYKKHSHKCLLGWEIPEHLQEDGKPFMVFQRYTVSLHENSALRPHLESWRGKRFTKEELDGFALSKIAGAPCMLSVTHSDDGKYANVSGVMALPKGVEKPVPVRDVIVFDIDGFIAGDERDKAAYDTFGDNLKKKIDAAKEVEDADKKAKAAGTGEWADLDDSDIPF